MTDQLTKAVHAAMREAAETAILPRYRSLADSEIFDKGGNDPVTVADREAEALLTERLWQIVPGVPVVGEEAAHADPSIREHLSGDCWIVDPLDGTRNFATGKPPFGVLVALASGGVAHTGWIYDCLSGRLCSAQSGKGAFIDGEKVTAIASGETPPVGAISLLYMDPAYREKVKAHVSPHYRLVDIPYCAAEQYPRLVLGENDVSIFERTLAWDHAAGVLFLNEAGGKAARPDGSAYMVSDKDRLGLIGAATPRLWDELVARIAAL